MAQVSRSTKVGGGTTLTSNTVARAADVETDMLALFNAHNNHDTGTSKWTVVSAQGSSSVPLVADNSSGTQNILEAKDNGTTVLSVADGGTVTVAPGGTTKAVLNSSGITLSNSATLAMGSAKITGLANGTVSTDAAAFGQIKYLQAVQYTTATSTATTSSTYTSTTLTGSITLASTSSRVKISVSGGIQCPAVATSEGVITVFRGITDLDPQGGGNGLARARNSSAANILRVPASFVMIDVPATSGSVTYTVKIKSADNTNSVAFPSGSTETAVMLLEEIL